MICEYELIALGACIGDQTDVPDKYLRSFKCWDDASAPRALLSNASLQKTRRQGWPGEKCKPSVRTCCLLALQNP